ncbi:MAG: 50S ribosomal protein L23 [Omnitrophica bacterium RIFCSPHIGHO2_02_FULL_46_11]|nr:MAG: 50S ribosomal protein L23 [Omnitrophica bacterium RIFCSPHIGHO2_02_FULL_46_11]OGW86988.1 MAG: 50S ribosomal protein L23 [Omnitrophica bacterium RIFCSPLOWO2_01_FULL_45_10b]
MNIYEVIRKPLITEKGAHQEKAGKYFFHVKTDAKKHEIREAVERIFNVKVAKVNTMVFGGKWKRVRFQPGKTSDWKKAIVTLKEGQKIEFA